MMITSLYNKKSRKPVTAPGLQHDAASLSTAEEAHCGRNKTPGHIVSPGVQHSSTSEVAPQKVQQFGLHTDSPLSVTHLSYGFVGIIAREIRIVNPFFKIFSY
jgi:hypothetical protein